MPTIRPLGIVRRRRACQGSRQVILSMTYTAETGWVSELQPRLHVRRDGNSGVLDLLVRSTPRCPLAASPVIRDERRDRDRLPRLRVSCALSDKYISLAPLRSYDQPLSI